jgi:hypothetical protein
MKNKKKNDGFFPSCRVMVVPYPSLPHRLLGFPSPRFFPRPMVIRLLTAHCSPHLEEREREERGRGEFLLSFALHGNDTGGREREGGYLLRVLTPMMAQAWHGVAWHGIEGYGRVSHWGTNKRKVGRSGNGRSGRKVPSMGVITIERGRNVMKCSY